MTGFEPLAAVDRRSVLREFGAEDSQLEGLLDLTTNPYRAPLLESPPDLPLEDEPQVEDWCELVEDAERRGALPALRQRLVQLRFPIEAGISEQVEYKSATRRGVVMSGPFSAARDLELERPEELRVEVSRTVAGAVPVISTGTREDFETLVRALSARNEPIEVPESMGACLVKGLVDWGRVERYRERWAERRGGDDEQAWNEEFRSLVPRKELYQDRLLVLSRGPYSAVDAAEIELAPDEWLARSLVLRRDHEAFHYLTLRLCGLIRSHLLDELLADFAGLLASGIPYRARLGLRFLGIEVEGDDPAKARVGLRPGARFALYLPDPPVEETALQVLLRLGYGAARGLELLARDSEDRLSLPEDRSRCLVALATSELEALASHP